MGFDCEYSVHRALAHVNNHLLGLLDIQAQVILVALLNNLCISIHVLRFSSRMEQANKCCVVGVFDCYNVGHCASVVVSVDGK